MGRLILVLGRAVIIQLGERERTKVGRKTCWCRCSFQFETSFYFHIASFGISLTNFSDLARQVASPEKTQNRAFCKSRLDPIRNNKRQKWQPSRDTRPTRLNNSSEATRRGRAAPGLIRPTHTQQINCRPNNKLLNRGHYAVMPALAPSNITKQSAEY